MNIEDKIKAFWIWFLENHARIEKINSPEMPLFKLVNAKLREIDIGLSVLIKNSDLPHTLIISANGNKELFDLVEDVVGLAPVKLSLWTFIALKPPVGFPKRTKFGHVELYPLEIWFIPVRKGNDESILGLRVGIPNFEVDCAKELKSAIYEILEIALGERRLSNLISFIEVESLPHDPQTNGWFELTRLPEFVL